LSAFRYEHLSAVTEGEFAQRGAELLEKSIRSAISKRGHCTLGLSGGSTPRDIYTKLGESKEIDWSKVTVFLVDERHVPPDHKESNQRLVRETLLKHTKIPPKNLIFPDTTLAIGQCIEKYEKDLRKLFPKEGPDIVVLGLGPDGHIASLFPGDIDALLEKEHLVLQTTTPSTGSGQVPRFAIRDRITVTPPLLTRATLPLFLLTGEEKKKVFAETLSANTDPIEYPAHALLQTGRSVWMTFF